MRLLVVVAGADEIALPILQERAVEHPKRAKPGKVDVSEKRTCLVERRRSGVAFAKVSECTTELRERMSKTYSIVDAPI